MEARALNAPFLSYATGYMPFGNWTIMGHGKEDCNNAFRQLSLKALAPCWSDIIIGGMTTIRHFVVIQGPRFAIFRVIKTLGNIKRMSCKSGWCRHKFTCIFKF